MKGVMIYNSLIYQRSSRTMRCVTPLDIVGYDTYAGRDGNPGRDGIPGTKTRYSRKQRQRTSTISSLRFYKDLHVVEVYFC